MKKVDLKALSQLPKKKIDSPLAKYNNVGQLFCVLCNCQVKNEMFWTGHVNGKSHRNAIINLKANKRPAGPAPVSSSSGGEFIQPPPPKKRAQDLPLSTSSGENTPFKVPAAPVPKSILRNGTSSASSTTPLSLTTTIVAPSKTEGPVDDEDDNNNNEDEHMELDPEQESNSIPVKPEIPAASAASQLPPGFFDDPKEDAKARGLEWRDPEEIEWEKFVKEIAGEEVKSSNLRTLDDEESTKSREIDEIEEQMAHWQKVIDLERKAEEVRKAKTNQQSNKNTNDSDEDEDIAYEEELDWRSKRH